MEISNTVSSVASNTGTDVKGQISTALLKKAMSAEASMVQTLLNGISTPAPNLAQPHLGANLDFRA